MGQEAIVKKTIQMLLCISCLGFMGCYATPAIFSTGTYIGYDGKIVDADTGAPIEGVVVLVAWFRESFFWSTDSVDTFCDARETVTDKNGYFSIEGGALTSNVRWTIIFKAGYEYLEFEWDALEEKEEGRGLRMEEVKWEGFKPIIPLRKLTMKQRRRQGAAPSPPGEAAFQKVKFYLKEINKDRIDRGLKPLTLWGGVRYE